MTRRHSRTPLVLTDSDRRVMVAAADANADLRSHIETLIGKPWDTLTGDQKIGALRQFEEVGFAAGSLAGAARGLRALETAASERRGDVSLADKVALLEEQLAAKNERVAALETDNKTLRASATRSRAKGAMAVHSEATR